MAIWLLLAGVAVVPVVIAVGSPLLAWRDPIYIASSFAGILAMVLLFFQPMLAAGHLPGLEARRGRHVHRWVGAALLFAVIVHVLTLWRTSPPDVIDALLFRSPTLFSIWGVVAMLALFATALVAVFRRRMRLSPRVWARIHLALAVTIVVGSVVHALLIEGAMGVVSKWVLCALVLASLGQLWKRLV